MKIERKETSKTFKVLKRGDVFTYNNCLFLKIGCDSFDNTFNLELNEVSTFEDEVICTPLDAKVVIE